MHVVETVLGLLVAICVLVVLARRVNVPYPIVLVLGGLALSLIPGLPHVELEPELVFALFLPPLLCAAAWYTSWRDFKANLRPISLLAFGLVFVTTLAVATAAHTLIPGLPWAVAFALGAIVSPPDAVAATAVLGTLGVPRRITTILEGESLVNDASGLVAYRFAVAAAVTGSFSPVEASARFLLLVVGIAVGFAVGWLVVLIQKQLEDAPIEIILTLLGAFASYLLAEALQVSGVLAVVTTGLYHRHRSSEIMSPNTRSQAVAVWRMVEFVLNGLAFILIGLQLPQVIENLAEQGSLATLFGQAAAICAVVIGVRLLWIFPSAYLPRLLIPGVAQRDPSPGWQSLFLIGWTGMRGVVTLAGALALPTVTATGQPFPGRDIVIFLAFSVILVTLVLQGLSLPLVIRWLGLGDDGIGEREEREARRQGAVAALDRLGQFAAEQPTYKNSQVLEQLRDQYQARLRLLESEEEGAAEELCRQVRLEVAIQKAALEAERKNVIELRDRGVISDEALLAIERDLDIEELRLKT